MKIIFVLFVFLFLFACGEDDVVKVAFVSGENINETEIYVVDAANTDERRLTVNDWEDTSPCWAHDNSQIAFRSTRDGREEVYIMGSDGGNPKRVTYFNKKIQPNNPLLYIGPDCWSKDGKSILFSFDETVYKVDSNVTNLVPYIHAGKTPGFSPNGEYISFTSSTNDLHSVNLMDIDGNNLREIVSPRYEVPHCSSWSSDSKKLACTEGSDLFLVEVATKKITVLDLGTSSEDAVVFGADWSPHGDKILYSVKKNGLEGSWQYILEVKDESFSLLTPKLFTGPARWTNKK